MLRGLCFAIVDEADSVLIDEARTPLLLSRPGDAEEFKLTFGEALEMAARLIEQHDFVLDHKARRVELTLAGRERVAEMAEPSKGIWSGLRRREEMICQALRARHLFVRDHHYLVRDGKVQIIDEATGRLMPDRAWERGLHQMIQAKEGCEISTPERDARATELSAISSGVISSSPACRAHCVRSRASCGRCTT